MVAIWQWKVAVLAVNGKSLNKTLNLWSWLFAFPSAQHAKAKRLRLCSINHVQVLRTYLNTTELLLGQYYRASSEIPSVVRTLNWCVKCCEARDLVDGSNRVGQGPASCQDCQDTQKMGPTWSDMVGPRTVCWCWWGRPCDCFLGSPGSPWMFRSGRTHIWFNDSMIFSDDDLII